MLVMSPFVSPQIFLVSLLAGWLNQEQQKVLEYLQEENRVLKAQLGQQLRLSDEQRRRLAAKGKELGRKLLTEVATLVTPDTVPSINSSCMRLANLLQPECFGRLHVGRFKSRRRLYSRGRGVTWCEVRQPFRAGRLKQRVECNDDGDHRPLEWLSLCPSLVTLPGEASGASFSSDK